MTDDAAATIADLHQPWAVGRHRAACQPAGDASPVPSRATEAACDTGEVSLRTALRPWREGPYCYLELAAHMGPRARGSTMSLRERAGGWSLEGRSPDGCGSSRARRRGGRASHREIADDSSDNSSGSIFMNAIFGSIRFSFLSFRFQLLLVASQVMLRWRLHVYHVDRFQRWSLESTGVHV